MAMRYRTEAEAHRLARSQEAGGLTHLPARCRHFCQEVQAKARSEEGPSAPEPHQSLTACRRGLALLSQPHAGPPQVAESPSGPVAGVPSRLVIDRERLRQAAFGGAEVALADGEH